MFMPQHDDSPSKLYEKRVLHTYLILLNVTRYVIQKVTENLEITDIKCKRKLNIRKNTAITHFREN